MKTKLFLSSIFIAILLLSNTNAKSETTIEFITSGNCYTCKLRIEGALSTVPGVISSVWKSTAQSTTVTYNEAVVDAFTIMQVVANVGHDTEWYQAPQAAYDSLIGTCCEYLRVLTYDNVNLGYLSLMGIYVYPLSINSSIKDNVNVLYPNPSFDVINIDMPNENNLDISIYNNLGQNILQTKINGITQINVSELKQGDYIVIIKRNDKIVIRKKMQKL